MKFLSYLILNQIKKYGIQKDVISVHTGYQGRIAIAECMQVDKELKEMIHNNSSENEIANYVFKDNQSIDQASRDLLINGITSADELIRVGNLKEDADI